MTKQKIRRVCIGGIIAAIVATIVSALIVLFIPRSLGIKNLTADINISKLSVSSTGDFLTETNETDKNSETAKKILEILDGYEYRRAVSSVELTGNSLIISAWDGRQPYYLTICDTGKIYYQGSVCALIGNAAAASEMIDRIWALFP